MKENMTKVVLIITTCLLYGCASDECCAPFPDVPVEFQALMADAVKILDVPVHCLEQHHEVRIVVDESEMPEVCHRDGVVLGCQSNDTSGVPWIWIVGCQEDPANTARHERLHSLFACMDGDPDQNHTRSEWNTLGVR